MNRRNIFQAALAVATAQVLPPPKKAIEFVMKIEFEFILEVDDLGGTWGIYSGVHSRLMDSWEEVRELVHNCLATKRSFRLGYRSFLNGNPSDIKFSKTTSGDTLIFSEAS